MKVVCTFVSSNVLISKIFVRYSLIFWAFPLLGVTQNDTNFAAMAQKEENLKEFRN